MLLVELLIGAGVGVWLRQLYYEYVFGPYPPARLALWGLLPPLAGGVIVAVIAEGLLRLVSRRRRSRDLLDGGLGVAIAFGTVIQTEAAKIGNELGATWLSMPWLPALTSIALAWLWVRYRAHACQLAGPTEDGPSEWSLAGLGASTVPANRRQRRRRGTHPH